MLLSMSKALRIAHLSDLHFCKVSKSPFQFFSKRWLGNMNLLFCRKKQWAAHHIEALESLLEEKEVDLVVLTGDATCTSQNAEFRLATNFFKQLKKRGMEVVALPGNHDHYTKKAYRERTFYEYFPTHLMDEGHHFSHYSLKNHAVGAKQLAQGWWLVALDTALATPWVSSRGLFSKEIEAHLRRLLQQIPQADKIIVANHFPFFQNDSPRKILVRGEALKGVLKEFSQVKLYIHGHTHRRSIADLRENGLPIVIDCGSTGMGSKVSWNLIDLEEHSVRFQHFESEADTWKSGPLQTFKL